MSSLTAMQRELFRALEESGGGITATETLIRVFGRRGGKRAPTWAIKQLTRLQGKGLVKRGKGRNGSRWFVTNTQNRMRQSGVID